MSRGSRKCVYLYIRHTRALITLLGLSLSRGSARCVRRDNTILRDVHSCCCRSCFVTGSLELSRGAHTALMYTYRYIHERGKLWFCSVLVYLYFVAQTTYSLISGYIVYTRWQLTTLSLSLFEWPFVISRRHFLMQNVGFCAKTW